MPSILVFFGTVISAVFGWAATFEKTQNTAVVRIMILVGLLVSAVGAFWVSGRQEQFNQDRIHYERALRSRSDEIAELHRTIAASVTGGESYCYLTLANIDSNSAFLVISHQGTYPLYDVSIRLVDLNKYEEVRKKFPRPTFEIMTLYETSMSVGNLSPGQARVMDLIQISPADKLRYNIFIAARNGVFTELLRFAMVKGVWKSAMKVQKSHYAEANPDAPHATPTVLQEKIDPDFPRDENGQVQWE